MVGTNRRRKRESEGRVRNCVDTNVFMERVYLWVRKFGREATPGRPRVRNQRI